MMTCYNACETIANIRRNVHEQQLMTMMVEDEASFAGSPMLD